MTLSAVYLPNKRPGLLALYRVLCGWSRLLYTSFLGDMDLSRCSEGIAGFAYDCVLFRLGS